MGGLRGQEILIIIILLIIVFGWKKLPDAARSLGRSARVFKSEVDEMKKDGQEPGDGTVHSQATEQSTPQPVQQPQVSPPPPAQTYQAESFQPPVQPPAQPQRQDPPDDPTRPVA